MKNSENNPQPADWESEAINQSVLESLPYSVFVADLELKLVFANRACRELHGFRHPDYLGQPCSICGAEMCGTDDCNIQKLQAGAGSTTYINNFRIITAKLLDRDGRHIGYTSTALDITDLKQTEKQLRVKEERFRIAMPYTNCGIWEYDPYEKILQRDSAGNNDFQIDNITRDFPESFIQTGLIHPRSIEDFRNMFRMLDRGELYAENEIVMYTKDAAIRWYRLAFTNIFDERGALIKAIGVSQDITGQKEAAVQSEKERRELLREVSTDALTGLNNRKYTVAQVEKLLAEKSPDTFGALYMIDVDDFKLINDKYGHQKGDEFLRRMADCMRSVFRREDLLCRVGGDEFLVFVNNMTEDVIRERADRLCGLIYELGQTFHQPDSGGKVIGVSIGIALVGAERMDFDELYRYADKALYATKSKGKNDYLIYGQIPL